MNQNVLRAAQGQAAVDRRVAVGLDKSLVNPFSWKTAVAPPPGCVLYAVAMNTNSGVVLVGGGDGARAYLWRKVGEQMWADLSATLPPDATGDVRAMVQAGSTWWIGGDNGLGGGWLAVSVDDGASWLSLTAVSGVTMTVNALATVGGVVLYVGCDGGELHQFVAPSTWNDLSPLVGFGSDAILDIACDGVADVMVVGGNGSPTVTCAYSSTAGAFWADRSAALGAAMPVRTVELQQGGVWMVGGDDLCRATRDGGVTWERWDMHPSFELLLPVYDMLPVWGDVVALATRAGLYMGNFRGTALLYLTRLGVPVRSLAFSLAEMYAAADVLITSVQGGSVVSWEVGSSPLNLRAAFAERAQGVGAHVLAQGSGLQLASLLLSSSDATAQDVILYDNTAAAGKVLATIHLPANCAPFEWSPVYPVYLQFGLTVVLATAGQDVTAILA